jgi:acyl dehydratase
LGTSIGSVAELRQAVGREIGVGPWVTVDQGMVDSFAELSGDHQWIHVDPERAASSPWGGTIAHGNLVLAMSPKLRGYRIDIPIRHGLNYGLDRLRFPAPLPVGSRVRMRTEVVKVDVLAADQVQFTLRNTVELEGSGKPVMVAEPITRYYLRDPLPAEATA